MTLEALSRHRLTHQDRWRFVWMRHLMAISGYRSRPGTSFFCGSWTCSCGCFFGGYLNGIHGPLGLQLNSNCSKMWPKWPRILLLLVVAAPQGILSENPSDTTPSDEEAFGGSTSPSTTPNPKLEETTDRLINGDLRKAARMEPMSGSGQKSGEEEQYDVIDVGAGTGSGRPKSGQTTRIYTTGEVDESFWLKHLGDDFKHAIHLQVGGTNEEYNRLINRTQNGVHEEVHHEYLPGAERPDEGGYSRRNQQQQQQSFDSRSLAMKQQYLFHQQAQQQQRYNYAQQHRQHYTPQPQQHTQQYQQYPQQHQHTQHPQQHQYPETPQYRPNTYQKPQSQGYIINSSEDQLHASQSNPAPVSSGPGGGGVAGGQEEVEGDSFDSQLNFKSPFNDYGSRPTRDLTYLLYRRGL